MGEHTTRIQGQRHPSTFSPELAATLKQYGPQIREVRQGFIAPGADQGKLIGHEIVFDQLPKEAYRSLSEAVYQRYGQNVRSEEAWQHRGTRDALQEPGRSGDYRDTLFNVSIRGTLPVQELGEALGLDVPQVGKGR